MKPHLNPLQAEALAIVGTAGAPLSTTEVRNQLNAQHTGLVPVVAEQVDRALRGLQRHALARRAPVDHSRNVYWQRAIEQQEAR